MPTLSRSSAICESDPSVKILPRWVFSPSYLAPCLVVFCQAPVALCFAENFPDSGSRPVCLLPPPLRPAPNSNFLHPASQFHPCLLSLSLLPDLSPNSNFLHPAAQFHPCLLSLSLLSDPSLLYPFPPLSRPSSIPSLLYPCSFDQVRAAPPLRPLALIVPSADRPCGATDPVDDRRRHAASRRSGGLRLRHRQASAKKQAQEQLAKLVSDAKHITNTKSGHDVHKERPLNPRLTRSARSSTRCMTPPRGRNETMQAGEKAYFGSG